MDIIYKATKQNCEIKVISSSINKGISYAKSQLLQNAKGKFIASIDADDEWTDVKKLKWQHEIICNNPSISIVAHNQMIKFEDRNEKTNSTISKDAAFSLDVFSIISFMHNILLSCLRIPNKRNLLIGS